jgi:hypothetical protein
VIFADSIVGAVRESKLPGAVMRVSEGWVS